MNNFAFLRYQNDIELDRLLYDRKYVLNMSSLSKFDMKIISAPLSSRAEKVK